MLRLVFLFSLFLPASSLFAQQSLFDVLCATGDTVSLVIDTDWRKLRTQKHAKKYQPLRLTFRYGNRTVSLPGKIRARGNVRLQACDNPSLKIKLKKDSLVAAGFLPTNDFKIVQQCSNSSLGRGLVQRERLVYDLHKIYSSHTHRTVATRITVDGQEEIRAFLVEDEEALGERYGRVLTPAKASSGGMHRPSYVNLCLFNYLIMNTDWQVFNLHNVELVADTTSGLLIPIPYDFDYSGFVGASYAVGREDLGQASIYTPAWQGRNVTEAEIRAGAEHFLRCGAAAKVLIEQYPEVRASDRKRMLKRLETFNKLLANEKKLLKLVR